MSDDHDSKARELARKAQKSAENAYQWGRDAYYKAEDAMCQANAAVQGANLAHQKICALSEDLARYREQIIDLRAAIEKLPGGVAAMQEVIQERKEKIEREEREMKHKHERQVLECGEQKERSCLESEESMERFRIPSWHTFLFQERNKQFQEQFKSNPQYGYPRQSMQGWPSVSHQSSHFGFGWPGMQPAPFGQQPGMGMPMSMTPGYGFR